MLSLIPSFLLRHLARHKLIALFDILSVAVGVSVYLAIQSANHSANEAFRASIDLTSGKSHLEIRGADGILPESWYRRITGLPEIAAATPVVEGYAVLPDLPGRFLHIVGADPFTNAPFQTAAALAATQGDFPLEEWLGQPGRILVAPAFASELGLSRGDRIKLEVDSRIAVVEIAGFLPEEATTTEAASSLAVMDIGWAQELLQEPGVLSSVQLLLEDPDRLPEVRDELRNQFEESEGIIVQSPAQRSAQLQRMIQGFQLNLTALSLVSILVGVFLIYNTVSASVVRRRSEIGILRSTGASRRTILTLFLGEGVLVGLPGFLLGIPFGLLLADALVAEVASTISSHYLLLRITEPVADSTTILNAFAFGLGATLVGALAPAVEAARLPPLRALFPQHTQLSVLSRQRRFRPLVLPLSGLLSLLIAGLFSWMALETGPPWLSFAACFALIAGFAMLTPALTRIFTNLTALTTRPDRSVLALGRLACDQITRSLPRASVTVAALMTALSMTIGVSVMVSSFRSTVTTWVETFMKADLYVTPAANEVTGFQSFLPPEILTYLDDHDAVRRYETYRQHELTLPSGHTLILATVENPLEDAFPFVHRDRDRILTDFAKPDHALATEPLARKLNLSRGDTLDLPTPEGLRPITIAGIYYDYGDDRGKLVLNRPNYHRYWDDPRVHSVAINLVETTSPQGFRDQLRARFGGEGVLAIYRNRDLKQRVFDVFDQTFAVTYVLRTISVLVACFGIGLSLTTLVMERTREIGILRAIGASRAQVRVVYLTEAGLMGWFSSLIGIACGLGMALVLTRVVNLAFFGWTIQLQIPLAEILATPLWVVPAALLAGWLPAARAARMPVVSAVREE